MAKQVVVQLHCDRCKRVEYRKAFSDSETPEHNVPELSLVFIPPGAAKPVREISFTDLCEPCRSTIINYIDHMAKETKKKSPERKAKKGRPDGDAQDD